MSSPVEGPEQQASAFGRHSGPWGAQGRYITAGTRQVKEVRPLHIQSSHLRLAQLTLIPACIMGGHLGWEQVSALPLSRLRQHRLEAQLCHLLAKLCMLKLALPQFPYV